MADDCGTGFWSQRAQTRMCHQPKQSSSIGKFAGFVVSSVDSRYFTALFSFATILKDCHCSLFTCPSSPTQYIATRILEDHSFTNQFIATNRIRIAESYTFVAGFLRARSIPFYTGANAAFFIWCNLGAYWTSNKGREDENQAMNAAEIGMTDTDDTIMQKLLAKKVFIANGADFGGEEPGWFRIVFTHPRRYLEEGMKRMIEALS